MLTSSFIHVPGLGGHTERSLWEQGCDSWDCFLNEPDKYSVGGADRKLVIDVLQESQQALAEKNHQYFSERLGTREAWRAWPEFRTRILYLDIETDGNQYGDSVTMIGLYDGEVFTALTKGENLENFREMISDCGMIVTFFGLGFDVPMLKKAFPSVAFDHLHMDLCATLKRVGVRGGLKKIERQFGISRSDETDGLNGRDAIFLWNRHLRGDPDALRILTEYNREDVVNLEVLSQITYDKMRAVTLAQGLLL